MTPQDLSYAKALCSALLEATRAAVPPPVKWSYLTAAANGKTGSNDASFDSKNNGVGDAQGQPVDGTGSQYIDGTLSGGDGGGAMRIRGADGVFPSGSDQSTKIGSADSTRQKTATTTCAANGSSTGHTGRTRTRTNVSLSTGTLAAERGEWQGMPWRIWPVHQASAAALVGPCLTSTVLVPEVVPLRQGLAALARRDSQAQLRVNSSMLTTGGHQTNVVLTSVAGGTGSRKGVSAGICGRSRGGGSGGGGGGRGGTSVKSRRSVERSEVGLRRTSGGGVGSRWGVNGHSHGSKTRALSCSPPGSPTPGVGAGGGMLVGAAHKRRRQDAVA